jgi:uncharacterized membrane protein YeaQ/YmgE (transglycosylase-associated protein family)
MELLFIVVFGAGIGGIVRYLVPGRQSHGIFLLPALGIAAASIVWAALTWLGFGFDGGWIWVASIAAAVIVPVAAAFYLPRQRKAADDALLARLSAP